MKNLYFLSFLVFCISAQAQQNTLDLLPSNEGFTAKNLLENQTANKRGAATVFWSENFSSGIPSTWTNECTTNSGILLPNGFWEYRGPSTTPNDTIGSRGAFSGTQQPIQSITPTNGFVIFDSDFLDNAGLANNFGNGVAPSPHIGRLTTSTINLTGQTDIELKLHSYIRKFQANFLIAISVDNGLTYPDTLEFYENVGLNASGPANDLISRNISSIVGGQAQVKLQFVFFSIPTGSTTGYFFWQIDDIELRTPPKHELRFTSIGRDNVLGLDYRTLPALGNPYGTFHINQVKPISGRGAVENYGKNQQTNVSIQLQVFNDLGILQTTLSTPITAALNSQSTTPLQSLIGSWVPTSVGTYSMVYTALSDSIGINKTVAAIYDTFSISVSNRVYALDDGMVSNSLGSNVNAYAMAVLYDFPNGVPFPSKDTVIIDGVEVNLSSLSLGTTSFIVEIFDTANFSFTNGFGASPIFTQTFNNTSVNSGGIKQFILTNGSGPNGAASLRRGSYYIVLSYFSSSSTVIRVVNSRSWNIPTRSSIFYSTAESRWFTGYSDSRNFNAPHVRVLLNDFICSTDTFTATVNACGNYQPLGSNNTYTTSGVYYDTLLASNACDSLVETTLTIIPNKSGNISITTCGNYTSPSGKVYTSSGLFTDSLVSSNGCDSLVTLTISIVTSLNGTISPSACFTYTSPSGNYVYAQSGTYLDTLQSTSGCDSVLTINLTIDTANTLVSQTNFILTATATNASYQWLDCVSNSIISGETMQTYAPTVDGNYAVIITENGCTDTSTCQLVQGIGLYETGKKLFSISPNPTTGNFTLQTSINAPLTLKIYDATGRLVDVRKTSGTVFKGKLNGEKGLYLIEVYQKKKLIGKAKLIKS